MTAITVLSVHQLKSGSNTSEKLHLNLLIDSTKTLSFSSIQHCISQLQSKHSRRQITVLKRNGLQRNTECKTFYAKHNSESVFRYFASAQVQ